ncbi:MAG: dephospho-CoA kinase, partial [Gammaproteobacteria bacterium]
MPFRVAVSGGIAAGKSAVCRILQQGGAEVIDSDGIAREFVEPGMPALAEIAI